MRSREQIQAELIRLGAPVQSDFFAITRCLKLATLTLSMLLEVALDIRELLIEKEAKEKK